jgi:hypothetical protein
MRKIEFKWPAFLLSHLLFSALVTCSIMLLVAATTYRAGGEIWETLEKVACTCHPDLEELWACCLATIGSLTVGLLGPAWLITKLQLSMLNKSNNPSLGRFVLTSLAVVFFFAAFLTFWPMFRGGSVGSIQLAMFAAGFVFFLLPCLGQTIAYWFVVNITGGNSPDQLASQLG